METSSQDVEYTPSDHEAIRHRTAPKLSDTAANPNRPGNANLPGNTHPQEVDDISRFVSSYNQVWFTQLAQGVVDRFKANPLKDRFDDSIKYQVSWRVKAPQTLEKNIRSDPNIQTTEQIHNANCIRDLAGVRILAYFPDDVPLIVDHFRGLFNLIKHPFVQHSKMHPSVSMNTNNAGADAQAEAAEPAFRSYPKGMWSQRDATAVVKDWKHSGYRAIQFLVNGVDAKDSNGHVHRHLQQDSAASTWDKIVEIQVTTIVMHAWSEVQHDLIYKNLYDLPPDRTIDRMVDATNGLAITSEILLQQLQQTFISVRKRQHEEFSDQYTLEDWIFETYFGWDAESRDSQFMALQRSRSFVHIVGALLFSPVFGPVTRAKIQKLLPRKLYPASGPKNPQELHSDRLDGLHLLRDLLRNEYNTFPECSTDPSASIQRAYKILLVGNMYSIWAGFSCWFSYYLLGMPVTHNISRCEQHSPDAVFPRIRKIHQILRFELLYSSIEDDEWEELEQFCDEYLGSTCCDEHEVAAKLAKLSYFPYVPFREDDDIDDDPGEVKKLSSWTFSTRFQVPSGHQLNLDRSQDDQTSPPIPIDFAFLKRDFAELETEESPLTGSWRYHDDRDYVDTLFGAEFDYRTWTPLFSNPNSSWSLSWWGDNYSDQLQFCPWTSESTWILLFKGKGQRDCLIPPMYEEGREVEARYNQGVEEKQRDCGRLERWRERL